MAISRAQLVDAARDLNKVLDLEPEIDVKLGVSKLREMVEEASRMVRATDPVADDTRAVINELIGADAVQESASEAEEMSEAEKSESASEKIMTKSRKAVRVATKPRKAVKAATKPRKAVKAVTKPATAKGTKKSELGRFSSVRRNSSLGKILEACLTDSSPTVGRVAKSVGISRDKVIPILRRARVTHGIDHGEGEDGELTIILPKGVDADSMWHKPKERSVKAGTVEAGNGRIKRRYENDDVITLRVVENPKQKGSAAHARFAKYRSGMTVSQFIASGGSRADLSWDSHPDRRFIEISCDAVASAS